jgi:CRISPR-associated protein Cmr1
MSKVEIKVQFETITPLWTGDAWMENNEIRPSSLIGSLRFWFEVICYFGGVCKKEEFNPNQGRFEKKVNYKEFKIKLLEHGNNFDGQVKTLSDLEIDALKKLGIPIPSIVFGTTGWKSLIEIREINFDKANFNDIEVKNRKIIPNKNWFWKGREYNGNFEVVFRVPAEIKETIFFPLLNFMDKYGYWGGGWNIGYGRLKVLSVNSQDNSWQKNEFDFSKFDKNKKIYIEGNDSEENKIVELVKETNLLTNKNPKIKHWKHNGCNLPVKDMLRNLIIEKANLRRSLNDQKERHYIFGKTGNIQGEDLPQGSKILPYINRLDNNSYDCGLLSIAGILNLYKEQENGQQ